jgi:CubicO group peptidase (beta-lactamase class C family)
MKRRFFVQRVGSALALGSISSVFTTFAEELTTPAKAEEEAIRSMALAFLEKFGIKGISIAYGRDGKIAFQQGYGFADVEGKEPVTPDHRFRIASVSKPITASAIMVCIEKGLLKLESKVFGPQGILGSAYGDKLPANVLALTVDHLLTNTSGWLSHWVNGKSQGDDPMFRNPGMNHQELITWALKNQKQLYPPGTNYTYSNFGYCILGRVLEKVTKQSYEKFVTQQVLSRCGISDMGIGGNTLKDRKPREVLYHE